MRDSINGETVYVCEYHKPPMSGHYGDDGEWLVCGATATESEAEMWVGEHPDRRRFETVTVGIVADR